MTDGDLAWPAEYPRTDPAEREPYPGDLSPTRKESFESIVDELERWGATEGSVDIDTASQHYADRPNIPHQHDKPDEVGVVARFRREDGAADDEHVLACDRWESQRENARAIALYARRMRLADKCGVTTAQSTMDTARLPPGDESADVIVAGAAEPTVDDPHAVLGVSPDASEAVVEAAARQRLKETHPDQGGDRREHQRVQEAREQLSG
ncbi:J domain-containing protein [Halobaculum sp. CBA1158]|uniref:J domain-containing protein n=1 Tax=Halobaculum sp. CBA1158 TaxID=2904243 RepID=UPI001F3F2461|nr:J domain-containing protein [Halobaculum sp. CBA1158]UIO98910.1 J domain-containing protein [Halobaculum sp. CBA1158]